MEYGSKSDISYERKAKKEIIKNSLGEGVKLVTEKNLDSPNLKINFLFPN